MQARRQLAKTNPTVEFRALRAVRDAMQERATQEGLTLASWVRHTCIRELKRRKKAA
jgi:hypothetical protein